jgi:hypothetical protein
VPNEFTDGKTGYNYHPYIYDTPTRKDRGLSGRLGETRKNLYHAALTSSAKIFNVKEAKPVTRDNITLKAVLAPLTTPGNSEDKYCVKITAQLPENVASFYDHFELLVGNSSTGDYMSLGKHRIVTSEFYFLDFKSVLLPANRLKYKLVGRSIAMENIFTTTSNLLDITYTNVVRTTETAKNLETPAELSSQAFRGFRK